MRRRREPLWRFLLRALRELLRADGVIVDELVQAGIDARYRAGP